TRTTTFLGAATLTAAIDAADVAAAGRCLIVVANPGPGGGVSSAAQLFAAGPPPPPNPVPALAAIAPSAVVAGSGAFTLDVTGAGFLPTSVIEVDGVPHATNFTSATALTAAV